MSRLLVLTTRELAAGYRLAGVAARRGRVARGGRGAARGAPRARGRRHRGARPVLPRARPSRSARRLDALRTPLVVPLPAGTTDDQAEDRRERLLQMLRQAVGYEITFGDEARTR